MTSFPGGVSRAGAFNGIVVIAVSLLLLRPGLSSSSSSSSSTSSSSSSMSVEEQRELRDQTVSMFRHAYDSYMTHAFPADELMPLSCRGRFRGSEPSRGNDDDALGNFTLTLVDSLDSLALIDADEFERAVKLVIENVDFDVDVIVSVFETNIRWRRFECVNGGFLSYRFVALISCKALSQGIRLYPSVCPSVSVPPPHLTHERTHI